MSTRVFVGRLSLKTKEEEIDAAFRRFGRIKKLDIKNGFAFVEYEESADAEEAIREMNGQLIDDSKIVVETAKGPRDKDIGVTRGAGLRNTGFKVTVEGLAPETSWQDLKDFARRAGRPVFTDVYMRGGEKFGIVEFETEDAMDSALRNLNEQPIHGRNVRIYQDGKGRGGGDRGAYDRGGRAPYGGRDQSSGYDRGLASGGYDRRVNYDRDRGGGYDRDRGYERDRHIPPPPQRRFSDDRDRDREQQPIIYSRRPEHHHHALDVVGAGGGPYHRGGGGSAGVIPRGGIDIRGSGGGLARSRSRERILVDHRDRDRFGGREDPRLGVGRVGDRPPPYVDPYRARSPLMRR